MTGHHVSGSKVMTIRRGMSGEFTCPDRPGQVRGVVMSEWTIDTLREHMQQQNDGLRALLEERYFTQVKALDSAFMAQQLAMQTAFLAADKAVTAALEAAEKAVIKAETAAERRFEAVNEFREQLSDQAVTFMRRSEAELSISRNSDAVHQLTATIAGLVTRVEHDAAIARNGERFQELADRVNRGEGHHSGLASGWVYLVGAIAAVSTLVTIYLAVKGHT